MCVWNVGECISRKTSVVRAASWCWSSRCGIRLQSRSSGSVESLPSDVIIAMFLKPKARVIKRVAAFMYGNCVGESDAVEFYNACNGMHRSYVETSMNAWFHVWDRDPYQRHKERYCCMTLKYNTWINGIALDQLEVLKPVIPVSKFRPAGTRCPLLTGCRIDFFRRGGDVTCKSGEDRKSHVPSHSWRGVNQHGHGSAWSGGRIAG